MHAEHAGELRVGRREAAQAHQRVRAGKAQQADQPGQLRRRVVEDHAAAGVDHRPLGFEQQLHRLLDLPGVSARHRVVRAQRDRLRIVEFGALLRDVLGDVDQDRARASGRREVEGLLDRDRQFLDVLDEEVVLDARAGDADRVAFLERVLADGVGRHLAGEDHHRDRIHVRGGDAGHRVGDARAGRHQRDADLVRRARIAVGGVDRALFVPHQDVLELVLLEDFVVDVEHRAARIAEDVLDAFFLQAADDDFCARQLHDSPQFASSNK